jgi:hypothetical protein
MTTACVSARSKGVPGGALSARPRAQGMESAPTAPVVDPEAASASREAVAVSAPAEPGGDREAEGGARLSKKRRKDKYKLAERDPTILRCTFFVKRRQRTCNMER